MAPLRRVPRISTAGTDRYLSTGNRQGRAAPDAGDTERGRRGPGAVRGHAEDRELRCGAAGQGVAGGAGQEPGVRLGPGHRAVRRPRLSARAHPRDAPHGHPRHQPRLPGRRARRLSGRAPGGYGGPGRRPGRPQGAVRVRESAAAARRPGRPAADGQGVAGLPGFRCGRGGAVGEAGERVRDGRSGERRLVQAAGRRHGRRRREDGSAEERLRVPLPARMGPLPHLVRGHHPVGAGAGRPDVAAR